MSFLESSFHFNEMSFFLMAIDNSATSHVSTPYGSPISVFSLQINISEVMMILSKYIGGL